MPRKISGLERSKVMRKPRRATAPFSHDYLKLRLHYEPKTGNWLWLIGKRGIKAGARAGYIGRDYNIIGINTIDYSASNLAWLYMTGEWPPIEVDHINRIKHDDRWENLRLATRSLNCTNRLETKKSGLPRGVCKSRNRYQAYICINGTGTFLGRFDTPKEAHEAYLKASEFRKEYLPQADWKQQLTQEQINEIKRSSEPLKKLALKFDRSIQQIYKIRRGSMPSICQNAFKDWKGPQNG
jgi:hypothetical protein